MSRRSVTMTALLVAAAFLSLAGMALRAARGRPGVEIPSASARLRSPREARVLIHSAISALFLRSKGPLSATCDATSGEIGPGSDAPSSPKTTATIEPDEEWALLAPHGDLSWTLAGLVLGPCRELTITLPGDGVVDLALNGAGEEGPVRRYPGSLRLLRVEPGGLFDVVNHVDVEPYTASVVASEVWPTFTDAALRAQAIASRTFVLYQMEQRESRAYDVSSTQGSQVYKGIREDALGRRAEQAARATRGVVCSVETEAGARLFCAYYSAACGGVTQSAAIFGPQSDVEPLSGGVRCDHCRGAPPGYFRWGPTRLNRDVMLDRLAVRFAEARAIDRIANVAARERSADGRAALLRVTGENGAAFEAPAERVRLLLGGADVRSTAFDVRVEGEDVVFDGGRGFGHGLGLCQWGSQGLSLLGASTADILHHYYPGMRLARAY